MNIGDSVRFYRNGLLYDGKVVDIKDKYIRVQYLGTIQWIKRQNVVGKIIDKNEKG